MTARERGRFLMSSDVLRSPAPENSSRLSCIGGLHRKDEPYVREETRIVYWVFGIARRRNAQCVESMMTTFRNAAFLVVLRRVY